MCLIFACLKSCSRIQNMTQEHIWCKNTAKTEQASCVITLQLRPDKENAQAEVFMGVPFIELQTELSK